MKIKVVNLSDKEKRIIYGELADQFDLDYSQELGKLKRDIEFALSVLEQLQPKLFVKKNVRVYEGGHHLDIIMSSSKRWVGQLILMLFDVFLY